VTRFRLGLILLLGVAGVSCASLRSTTIDIEISGEVRLESMADPTLVHVRSALLPGQRHPQQASPYAPLLAEIGGARVRVEVSTTIVSFTIERGQARDMALQPSAGTMRSNFQPKDKPLACVVQDTGLPNLVPLEAGKPWRYFCGGPRYDAIYPSGFALDFQPDVPSTSVSIVRSGIGNTFVVSVPATLNGVIGRLVVDLRATDAEARASYR
jgi:hypothetical protein